MEIDGDQIPGRISPVEIFDPFESDDDIDSSGIRRLYCTCQFTHILVDEQQNHTSTSTQQPTDLLSKVLLNNMDESVRPIEM